MSNWRNRVESPPDANRGLFFEENMSPESNFAHAHLLKIVQVDPGDYEPWGNFAKNGFDCSCGCARFARLEGELGSDWGVCCNPDSHRCGMLTFEHQGCDKFTNHPIGKEGQ